MTPTAPSQHTEFRNLISDGDARSNTLIARHALKLPSGEIFVVTTEARPDGTFQTTTTLLFWAGVRRQRHETRRDAVVDHSSELRRLLALAQKRSYKLAAG
jgi:hypothetical protein